MLYILTAELKTTNLHVIYDVVRDFKLNVLDINKTLTNQSPSQTITVIGQ